MLGFVPQVGRYSSLMGHAGPIWDIVPVAGPFGSADRGLPPGTFASASADGTVRLWNLGEGGGFGQLGASTGLKGSAYCKSLIGIMYVESEATKDERLR